MNEPTKLQAIVAYAVCFAIFTITIGRLLHSRGRVFLSHSFSARPEVSSSVQFLLDLGFYLTCIGLLLLNLGLPADSGYNNAYGWLEALQTVATRLGFSIFTVAAFHTANILILSLLNRRNRSGEE